jgi:hypothetical protein
MFAFTQRMYRTAPLLSALVSSLILAALPRALRADDYAEWARVQNLYTNTSPDGAYVTSTVRKFPLLVRLDTGNFVFSEALKRGQDIRFSDTSGKHLPYQIERWDSAGAAAEIWVRLDSVAGNSRALALRMHWGKADAADSSDGAAVFDSADGAVAAWHLGGADTLGRANAVAGGLPAVPVRYDGDESRKGIIGLSDSLDGLPDGDYLNLGEGYADFSTGFTYSVWAAPSNRAFWSRLLDMGNGGPMDNLVLQRRLSSDEVDFYIYDSTDGTNRVSYMGALLPDEWQFLAVTVGPDSISIFRNGVRVASQKLKGTIPVVVRKLNYIGKSNWGGNAYYQGRIDEARLCKVARGADWIKLSYANQKADQNLLSFMPLGGSGCTARFAVPKDTTAPEGSPLELAGIADCADSYSWTLVSGPGPRILDPEVRSLQIALPRVAKDAALRYRFSARYLDATVEKDVLVTVAEAIPDPAFTMAPLAWNGKDSVLYKPKITNLAVLQGLRDSVLTWSWTLFGLEADTAWRDSGLLLESAPEGSFKIGLCLGNGGDPICKSATVNVGITSGLAPQRAMAGGPVSPAYDARGRRLKPASAQAAGPSRIRRPFSVLGFFR